VRAVGHGDTVARGWEMLMTPGLGDMGPWWHRAGGHHDMGTSGRRARQGRSSGAQELGDMGDVTSLGTWGERDVTGEVTEQGWALGVPTERWPWRGG